MVAPDFSVPDVSQTPWSCGHNGATWYACVHADIDDEVVIDTAKRLVDHALPQKLSTFFGGHYYSFVTREYLLNLLLFNYQEYRLFPVGSVCVVERWPWAGQIFKRNGKWFNSWAWRFSTTRAELKAPGYWVQIPPVSRVMMKETTSDTQEPQQSQIGIL